MSGCYEHRVVAPDDERQAGSLEDAIDSINAIQGMFNQKQLATIKEDLDRDRDDATNPQGRRAMT